MAGRPDLNMEFFENEQFKFTLLASLAYPVPPE